MSTELKIICLKGQKALPFISDLAQLRIKIFREYPYLYEGDVEYENNYLRTYVDCSESFIVLVKDKERVVGVSTAVPLQFEMAECKKPFLDHGMVITEIFYLGESVLLPEYRGQGIYKSFFKERESAAREYGAKTTAFCAVERSEQDLRKPKDYVPLDTIWRHFGYEKHPELCAYFEWKEIGEKAQSPKPMHFWLKRL